jgi:hypothetical protein
MVKRLVDWQWSASNLNQTVVAITLAADWCRFALVVNVCGNTDDVNWDLLASV